MLKNNPRAISGTIIRGNSIVEGDSVGGDFVY
jgi:hypothetical protein